MQNNQYIHAITANNFEEYLQTCDIMFVDFWATWCAPCKNFARTFAKIAAQYPAITFCNVNIEQEDELAKVFAIQSVPHLMIFKKCIAIYSESGAIPEAILQELAKQALAADISDIINQTNMHEE